MIAACGLARKRLDRDRASALTISAMGARGESKKVSELIKDWSKPE